MRKFSRFFTVVSVLVLLAGQSWAASNCHDIHVTATNTAVDPTLVLGRYAGSAIVTIDGEPPIPAALSLTPLEFKMGDDGTAHFTTMLTFDFGQMGGLTLQDNAVLSPTDNPYLYTMNSRFDNMAGTGVFTGAVGRLTAHGQYSFATVTVTAESDGRICW